MLMTSIKCQFEPIVLEYQQSEHNGTGYILCEECLNSIIALAQQGKGKYEIFRHLVGRLQGDD